MPLEDKQYLDKIGKVLCVEFLDHSLTTKLTEKTTIEAFGILEDEDNEHIFLVQSRIKHSSSTDYERFEQFNIVKSTIQHITEYEIKEDVK